MPIVVPRLWPDSTIAIVASGPSLTSEDCQYLRGRARIVAVKDAVRLLPFADVCYACDARWWNHHEGLTDFGGRRYALEDSRAAIAHAKRRTSHWEGVELLANTGEEGLELSPSGLRTGKNSGYQAINLAVHLGASRIVLLGYDMQHTNNEHHFFGRHPWNTAPACERFRPFFDHLVTPLGVLGVSVVNATRETALTAFPRLDLEDALP